MGAINTHKTHKISCELLNKGVFAIIYDHIGRRFKVLLSRLERAKYECWVGTVDLDWKCLAVYHFHSGTRSDCDFEDLYICFRATSYGCFVGSVSHGLLKGTPAEFSDLSHMTPCSKHESD